MIDPTHYDCHLEPEEAATAERRRQAAKPVNRLIVIGWLGVKRAYLNVPRDEAMARFTVEEQLDEPLPESLVKEFEFTDAFGTYDAWAECL